jgi:serine/threonine protein kinase/tetratricopeptide (TPR) repeat protein
VANKCPKCQAENPETARFCLDCGMPFSSIRDLSPEATKTIKAPLKELTRGSLFARRYEIIEELGKGGMGKVYRVFDKKIDEEVALKLIMPEIAADAETIKRFSNELKLARKIGHRNVGKMYELMEEEGAHFITMEYVPGENLKSMIRMSGQLGIGTAISIAKQICEGLAEAHRLGVVHRDLKPGNIMMDREGIVRIMDFGIARSLKMKGITGEGMIIGTPEYMSPEQVQGKEADQRSDIYSLGIILFEMLTGKVPFEGDTSLSIALKQVSEPPPNPKAFNRQIPEELSRIVLKCMNKKKESRYQDIEKLILELETVGDKEPAEGKISEMKWKSSIAVLPFVDLSQEQDQEYFCDGLAEELINALSKIRELRVVARTSAFAFKNKPEDVREIGKKLGVKTVLEGSVRKAGNRLRITVQLIDVGGAYHLWSERYDKETKDVFSIQDEIASAVVNNLKIELIGEEKVRLIKRYTEDLNAYSLFLEGLFFWNKRTEEGIKKAISLFDQAIQRDQHYAIAYAGIANSFLLLPIYSSFNPKDAHHRAKEAIKNALEIDNNLPEAIVSQALFKLFYDRNWSGAEQDFKQALTINPGYAFARTLYASELMVITARFDEAIEEMKRSLEMDPLSLVASRDIGMIYYYARKFDQAILSLKKTIEMDPNFIHAHGLLGLVYLEKSMYEEALFELKREVDISGGSDPTAELWIGIAHARMEKVDDANEILENILKRTAQSYICPYFVSLLYFGLKENKEGFNWLNRAYEENDSWLNFMKVDPGLEGVRSDPRFRALIEKMNLG